MKEACHRFRRAHRRSARRRTARCAARGPTSWRPRPSARRCGARPGIDAGDIDDVILGCAMPEAEQGMNVARIASLRAGIPVSASAVTVNRFCSSGLQAIAYAAERIMCGFGVGDRRRRHRVDEPGADGRPQDRAEPALVDSYPDVYLSTGLVAENHAREYGHLARGAGRVRAAQPSARARGDRRRPLRRRDRAGHRARRRCRANGGDPRRAS